MCARVWCTSGMARRAKLRVCAAPKGKCAATRAGRSRASGAYRATKGFAKSDSVTTVRWRSSIQSCRFNLIRCPSPFPHPLMNRSQGWYGPYGAFSPCLAATSAHPSHLAPSTGRSRLVRPHHTLPPSEHTRVSRRHSLARLCSRSLTHSLLAPAQPIFIQLSRRSIRTAAVKPPAARASLLPLLSSRLRRRRSRGAVVHHSRSPPVGAENRRVGAHVGAQLLFSPRYSPAPHHLRFACATELSCNGRKRQEWRKREKAASPSPTPE